ncbi:MAG: DNA polymerase III subunit chi [Proteobacteria bacterium]|nr:DNA polymerase III subunit chi [Pseudomonadota bacterium]HQR02889.1 DNA polymerase III subunit chi [Rhodocyclaceae bacterium]
MTCVRFFHGARDRIQTATDWVGQAWSRRRQVLIYAPVTVMADRLDRQLWMQQALSFIPHCRADAPHAAETPILIARHLDDTQGGECLLNLSDEVPPAFSRFEELIEIISVEDEVRLPGRERFRFYREQGCELDSRDVSGGMAG